MIDQQALDRLAREHNARMLEVLDVLENEALPTIGGPDSTVLRDIIAQARKHLGRNQWWAASLEVGSALGMCQNHLCLTRARMHELHMKARYDEEAAVAAGAQIPRTKPPEP